MRKTKEVPLKLFPPSEEILKQKEYHMLKSLEVSANFKYVMDAWVLLPHHFPIKFISLTLRKSDGYTESRLPQTQLTLALITNN